MLCREYKSRTCHHRKPRLKASLRTCCLDRTLCGDPFHHNRKGTGYILRILSPMPEAPRVTRAVYKLKD